MKASIRKTIANKQRRFICLLFAMCFSCAVNGQLPATLDPGCTVRVRIPSLPENKQYYRVTAQGMLDLGVVESFPVTGKSKEEIAEKISRLYSAKLNSGPLPFKVEVSIVESIVKVTGMVNHPGTIPLSENLTISDALSAAGGLKDPLVDRKILLIRPPSRIRVDVAALRAHPDSEPVMLPGDMLEVE